MKRWLKLPARAFWRLTGPLRRPFYRRLEALIRRNAVQPAPHVHVACHVTEETNLLMNHMVRELVRLQTQVERLRESVEDLAPTASGLAVVGDDDDDEIRAAAG